MQPKTNNLYQKHIKMLTFASSEGRKMLGNFPFLQLVFRFLRLHIGLGLPRSLWTAFEIKNGSEDVKKSAACDCANGEWY